MKWEEEITKNIQGMLFNIHEGQLLCLEASSNVLLIDWLLFLFANSQLWSLLTIWIIYQKLL